MMLCRLYLIYTECLLQVVGRQGSSLHTVPFAGRFGISSFPFAVLRLTRLAAVDIGCGQCFLSLLSFSG